MDNYVVLHLHSDLSSCVTSIDSVTKPIQYIKRAQECGMTALAFSEHGSFFSWIKKKEQIEAAGMKYIHAAEFYVTKTLDEKIRDNKHCLLIARNYEGVLELNRLSSQSFNREDGHFYFVPRITIDELCNTSDNVIITSACLGGILNSSDKEMCKQFFRFMITHKDRCFLEIQHHANSKAQKEYNVKMYKLSQKYDIPLCAGTDTHALNDEHLEARSILQKAKNISFPEEDEWDLTFKTYDELVEAYKKQGALPMDVVLEAIENTNRIADMVESFELDRSYKYPHLWDNPEKVLMDKIKAGIKWRGVDKFPNKNEYADRVKYELKAYKHNKAIDFVLLMEDIVSWCRTQDIQIGYGRGSVNGSVIAWLLGITEMDSIKHKLNFDRFMNVERVSLSDIDTDFPPSRIEDVKQYIFNKHGLYCCDIVTFNTIADKGSIRDVIRGLYKSNDVYAKLNKKMQKKYDQWRKQIEGHDARDMDVSMPSDLQKAVDIANGNYMQVTNDVLELFERSEEEAREKYPEIFKYVDLTKGVVVSMGNHPCGTVVAPYSIDDRLGLCTTSTDKYPISQIYMKEIDGLNYVKLDLLKLDTIELIANTCKAANIPMVTPDNLDINDINVWNSMRDDTTQIFQWEGKTGDSYIKRLLSDENIKKFQTVDKNIDRMTLLSIGNSAIRPAGASYRDDLANGIVRKSGSEAIDDFLKPTFGYLVFQCQIIEFLHSYCGFTMGEADVVRRHFAKKTGTEQDIPVIKDGGYISKDKKHYIPGFVATMKEKYNMPKEEAEQTIVAFLQVITDASEYLFSINHSQPYSYEGYASAWLRYYYPTEFLTCALNINQDNEEKTLRITEYAKKVGINIRSVKFGFSKGDYTCDASTKTIYKGLSSIKHISNTVAEELYSLRNNHYDSFIDILVDLKEKTSCNSRQLEILIGSNFFEEYGGIHELLQQVVLFNALYTKKQLKREKVEELGLPIYVLEKHCGKITEKMFKDFDSLALLKDIVANTEFPHTSIYAQLMYQNNLLGYCISTLPKLSGDIYFVMGITGTYKNMVSLYRICDGSTKSIKFTKSKTLVPLEANQIIKNVGYTERFRKKKVGEDPKTHKPIFEETDEKELVLSNYIVVNH